MTRKQGINSRYNAKAIRKGTLALRIVVSISLRLLLATAAFKVASGPLSTAEVTLPASEPDMAGDPGESPWESPRVDVVFRLGQSDIENQTVEDSDHGLRLRGKRNVPSRGTFWVKWDDEYDQ